MKRLLITGILVLTGAGCSALPDISHQPQFHNPFPQLTRIAVLPFTNQSSDPTVDGRSAGEMYRNELQQIPGFQVMPMGVVEVKVRALQAQEFDESFDFQKLAQVLGVDAVVVGAITDFSAYYPPRMGLSVSWYAANPSFHPVPAGYGLPWGTAEEEYIPEKLVLEAEYALAREQLATQTPGLPGVSVTPAAVKPAAATPAAANLAAGAPAPPATPALQVAGGGDGPPLGALPGGAPGGGAGKPSGWPDPRGFVPRPPSLVRPPPNPQREPVFRQMRQYDASDAEFTTALKNYHHFRDDARAGGWQAYLQRKEDFIRFCCHLHIVEMLAARGGAGETRVVWEWPSDR